MEPGTFSQEGNQTPRSYFCSPVDKVGPPKIKERRDQRDDEDSNLFEGDNMPIVTDNEED